MEWLLDKAKLIGVAFSIAVFAYAFFYFLQDWAFYVLIIVGVGFATHRLHDKLKQK